MTCTSINKDYISKSGLKTSASRSYNMSKIKGKNTKPEVLFRKGLWSKNIRFRIHVRELPGKPDIVIKKYKLVIFIDGEFWHGYQWEQTKNKIMNNRDFWISKIEKNIQRDISNNHELWDMGYTIFRFWTKDVYSNLDACLNQVILYINAVQEISIPERDSYTDI